MKTKEDAKKEILQLVNEYYHNYHKSKQEQKFEPGETRVTYAGRVYDNHELVNLVDSSLDFWLTYGNYSAAFEKKLADFLGVRWAFLVNSGSSANLLAFFTLTSHMLGERRIQRGDEVITVAAGFPTTIAPIVQYGAIPVFVDVSLETANIDVTQLEKAISPKTKAIMIAHTLGNPFDLKAVKEFADRHNLWLVEDNCDALGSTYNGQYTGTVGDIGTSSFYPPHHMTMGEGGAVYTNNAKLKKIILSMRDWGRDCWCDSGQDNTCGKRFSQEHGTLPFGYDHKYVYSHFGFNLKVTDMQAAIGVAQLEKLPGFIEKRRENFQLLSKHLSDLSDYFILPTATENSEPSWFGFLLIIKEGAGFKRNELVEYLEKNRIQTRNLFAGDITRHPAVTEGLSSDEYRVVGTLKNTDKILNDSFWVGLYPGMSREAINYMAVKIREFVKNGTD